MQNEKQHNSKTLELTYEFDAPMQAVFNAFSNAGSMARWWGPAGYEMKIIRMDFRPGGIMHYCMESPGHTMWARLIFGKIAEPEHLEFILSFSDENGGITRAPFFNPWPLEILNIITLEKKGKSTILHFKSYPVNYDASEMESFIANKESYREGTGNAFTELGKLLGESL